MSKGGSGVNSKQDLLLPLLAVVIFFQSIPGLADNPTSSKDAVNAEVTPNSSNSRNEVFFVCFSLVGVAILSIILFKLWRKKKREEQQASLLRLFEEDDELELELGLQE
ncbi:hypothetical protein Cni_G24396 [Canna indica]|uniref:Uncharacterized protein n=1 Tax=Canna indica TaxID=4628 RepID=A0AAQ3QPI5_9LILI|nr:hypothetical protein Cni_G24396 [Canna indica]